MGGIHLNLPVVSHATDVGRLEPQIDDPIDKEIDKIDILGVIDALSHVQDTIESGGWKNRRTGFENGKSLLDQRVDVPGFLIFDDPGQRPVDVPERLLMDDGQTGKIHLVEKKQQSIEIAPAVCIANGAQSAGNFSVSLDDLIKPGKFEQAAQDLRRTNVLTVEDGVQGLVITPEGRMGDRFKNSPRSTSGLNSPASISNHCWGSSSVIQ